jgi:hypothetical protein
MRDLTAYLILAVFIASGVSFFDGLFARLFVRVTIVVVGFITAIGISLAIFFGFALSEDYSATSLTKEGPRMFGDAMLILYLGACVLTCVPLLSTRQLRTTGLVLHFVVMPVGAFLKTFSALSLPWEIRMSIFGHVLSLGLIYAMLWFRMAAQRLPHGPAPGSAPAN